MALTIDFHGPIAFRFTENWTLAYVPQCDYHTCNILTDSNDICPDQQITFQLSGPTPGKTQIGKGSQLVLVNWNNETQGNEPRPQDCYCIFKLPPPDIIIGLRADFVHITKPSGYDFKGDVATGLRVYYRECPEEPIFSPPLSSSFPDLDATYSQPVQTGTVNFRIEIRYHDTNPMEPRPHGDAFQCSLNMRKLFPPLDQWMVDFNNGQPKPFRPLSGAFATVHGPFAAVRAAQDQLRAAASTLLIKAGPGGSDCGANVLAFSDGGLTF